MILDFLKDLLFFRAYDRLEALAGWALWRFELARAFRTARGWSPEVVRGLIAAADPLELLRCGEPGERYRAAADELVRLCPIMEACTSNRVIEVLQEGLNPCNPDSRSAIRIARLGRKLHGLHAKASEVWHDDSWEQHIRPG